MMSLRGAGAAAVVLGAFLILSWGVFLMRAELSWRRAQALAAEGDMAAAASAARAVFDLYVPANPRLEHASRFLWDAARAREAAGDRAGALAGYRTLRSAWIGARPIGGDGGWIARTEERIARLAGGQALAAMRAPRRPHSPWGWLAALGFAAWGLAAAGFIARGVGPDGRPRPVALRWAGAVFAGYAVWILGLIRA